MDLMSLVGTVRWHKESKEEHSGGGLFIVLPHRLAKQLPTDGKEGEDESPPHITLLYIDDVKEKENKEENYIRAIREVCKEIKPFQIKLGKTKSLINQENKTVHYLSAESRDLFEFNLMVKRKFDENNLDYSKKFKEFKPHITISYTNEGEESKYKDFELSGDWRVDNVWLWGFNCPKVFMLG